MFCFAVFKLLDTDEPVRLLSCLRNVFFNCFYDYFKFICLVCHTVFMQYSFHHLCVAIRNTRGYHLSWKLMEIIVIVCKNVHKIVLMFIIIIPLPRNRAFFSDFFFVFQYSSMQIGYYVTWLHSLYLHRLPCSQPPATVGVIAFNQSISELIILTKIITSLVIRKEIVYWLHKGIHYVAKSKYRTKNRSSCAKIYW